jgi:hypothetical protein
MRIIGDLEVLKPSNLAKDLTGNTEVESANALVRSAGFGYKCECLDILS